MRVIKIARGHYEIVDVPHSPDHGPYRTKAEAEQDRAGMARTIKANRDIWPAEGKPTSHRKAGQGELF